MLCSVTEHGMTSLSFQIAIHKNEEKLSSFVQFENGMESYRALLSEQSKTSYVLTACART